jgi:hypothetical protein
MTRALISIFALAACGGTTQPKPSFSPAALTIDKTKLMSQLTDAERTSMCTELTRSLMASFGPNDVACKFGSLSGSRQGKPDCQAWFDQCESEPMPVVLNGCTEEQMMDMWSCPITAGDYEVCFNAVNGDLLTYVVDAPVCQASSTLPAEACAAQCDYVWFD